MSAATVGDETRTILAASRSLAKVTAHSNGSAAQKSDTAALDVCAKDSSGGPATPAIDLSGRSKAALSLANWCFEKFVHSPA